MKHPDYIERVISDLDYIKHGSQSFYYVNPPKHDDQCIEFGSHLMETAEEKIAELLDRHDFIDERYKNNTRLINKLYSKYDDFTREFYIILEASAYSEEAIYIKKWIRYWKRIYETISKKKIIKQDDVKRFTDSQLEQAREVPIEGMYEGSLRTNYGKQIGLCPFHEENTPSFTIFQGENTYHCFGCQAHGDAIDYWMKTRNVDFIQAVKDLLHE